MQEQMEMLLNMITELKNELSALQDRVADLETMQSTHMALKIWQEQTEMEDR